MQHTLVIGESVSVSTAALVATHATWASNLHNDQIEPSMMYHDLSAAHIRVSTSMSQVKLVGNHNAPLLVWKDTPKTLQTLWCLGSTNDHYSNYSMIGTLPIHVLTSKHSSSVSEACFEFWFEGSRALGDQGK